MELFLYGTAHIAGVGVVCRLAQPHNSDTMTLQLAARSEMSPPEVRTLIG